MKARQLLLRAWGLAALALSASTGQAQEFPAAPLDSALRAELAATRTPGAAMAVLVDGRVAWMRGAGVTDVETGEAVTPQTLFRIASVTKMITAAAALVLESRGRLDLGAPVRRYLPGLAPAVGALTMHQLLSHTSGLHDAASDRGPHDDGALLASVRAWRNDVVELPPGRFFSYANTGYDLAGAVIERVTGVPFADALDTLIFSPVGMTRSAVRPHLAMTWPLSQGHHPDSTGAPRVVRPVADDATEWPAGGVYTSAEELARFVQALLADGMLDGRRVLPAGLLARMGTGYAPELDVASAAKVSIGYGFNVRPAGAVTQLQHGGSMRGFGSIVRLVPERRFAVVVLANRTGAALLRTTQLATDLLAPVAPPAAPPSAPRAPTRAERAALAGRFVNNPRYLALTLFERGDSLWLRQEGAPDSSSVLVQGPGRFVTEGQPFAVTTGKSGRVEFLHIVGHTLARSRP